MHHPQCLPLWGCVGDWVETVVKVHCGTVLGDKFHATMKMRPGLLRNLKVANCCIIFFPPPWWYEVHIFPTLTPVAQVAITVCLFPRKRAPATRFTALNNLPFHHGSPAIEPCYKFPCASNRLHIAQWHWAHVFCFVLYYWAARKGNVQSRITFHLCRRKKKWRTELPEGFACPITPLPPASMEPISAGRGRVISGRLANRFGSRFNTNTKLLRGVIGPISAPYDYRNTVFGWGS